jgi:hypothetical protein
VDWIGLAQDREKWRALVNVVMNLPGSIICCEVLEWLQSWCINMGEFITLL